ncbi:MAG TPA: hypothetical protein VF143_11560 [Candidatus Nanopelagicales bacterium]
MEPMTADQQDTLVLQQHDTVVLGQGGAGAAPDQPATGPVAEVVAARPQSGASGWQAVQPWRDLTPQQVATAWSQVPPFIAPTRAPTIVLHNNPAVVGATLGSVALFLALLPVLGVVAWLIAPIGLLSSGIGLVLGMARKAGRVGAIWGLCTSGLALVVCVAWTALLLAL